MNLQNTLKSLNQMPFPVTLKHRVALDTELPQLRGGEDWAELRSKSPRYRIPATREEWLQDLAILDDAIDSLDAGLPARVESLARLLEREGIETFFSVGSGGCYFEYLLKKRLPNLRVIVTEPVPALVEHLKKLFIEADSIEVFDALDQHAWARIAALPSVMVFIYRNEREFTNREWRIMFRYMHQAGIERVFLGLMWTLTARALLQIKYANLRRRLRGVPLYFAGYIRNRAALAVLWKGSYTIREEIEFPACAGLYLHRI